MKKFLAIILTIAMLCSMFAVGVSAAERIVSQDAATENHYWNFPAGNSWHPVKFDNPASTVEMDVRLDDATASLGCYDLSNAPAIGPSYVGLMNSGTSVAYTFEVGTWYHLKYVSASGSTTIYVDGAEVGTVAAEITYYDTNQFYWSPVLVSMDNVSVGGQTFDFEGDTSAWNTESSQGQLVAEEIPGAIHNEIVAAGEDSYWNFPAGNNYNPVEVGAQGEYFDVEMDIRIDDAEGGLKSGWDSLAHAPIFTATEVGIGGGQTSAFTAEVGRWYHVKWDAYDNGASNIFVDGALVATLIGVPTLYDGTQAFWQWDRVSIDNLSVGTYFNDMESGGIGGQGAIAIKEVETYRAELGQYYWNFQAGNSWHPVKFDNPSTTVEMDVKLDDATASLGCYDLSNAPAIGPSYVGLMNSGTSIPYTFEVGKWYHLKYVSASGSTTIYVDGVEAGTVAAEISYYDGNQFYWSPVLVSMDNVSVGGQTFDFEGDTSAWNTESGQGQLVQYDLTVASDSIFDHIITGEVPGGEAYILKPSMYADSIYTDLPGINPNGTEYIVSFDLAMVPYGDTSAGVWFELWTNTASRRWKVGQTFAGCQLDNTQTDYVGYEWGDLTRDNFHNITYVMDQAHQKAAIYIDQVLVYENMPGEVWADRFLGMAWHCSAILDNIHLYDLDYNEISIDPMYNDPANLYKVNNLDVTDAEWCATNGHMPSGSEKTVLEPGVSQCVNVTYCHYCDAIAEEQAIEWKDHNWPAIGSGTVTTAPTDTTDGVMTWTCKNAGCTATATDIIPALGTYTGTIRNYFSFETADPSTVITEFVIPSGGQSVENGKAIMPVGCGQSYNQFYDGAGSTTDWSVSFDFCASELFFYNEADNNNGWGHQVFFWFGGVDGMANMAGYNFDEGYYFIKPSTGSSFEEIRLVEEMPMNEWHTLTFRFHAPGEDAYWDNGEISWCSLEVDGVVKVKYDDDFAFYDLAGAKADTLIIRDFGVAAEIDNFVVGSSDFAWVEPITYGDVNDDGRVNVSDLILLRGIASGSIYPDTVYSEAAADITGDGKITSADVLALKKILIGE